MTSYKIPKLKDKPINFFSNKPSSSQVIKQSDKKLQNRENNVLSQLQQDRVRRQAEIRRLEILNDSSLQVEKDIKKRAEIEAFKVLF